MTDPAPYRRSYWPTQPEYLYPPYRSTVKRAPTQPLVVPPQTISEVTGPLFGHSDVRPVDVATAAHVADHDGRQVYFCSAGCRAQFERDPVAGR